MTTPVALIVNRNARRLRVGSDLAGRLTQAAEGRASVFTTHSLDELERAVEHIVRGGIPRVVLCGGDGTLMAGVSALHRHAGAGPFPDVCFVPCGTVATVARNWGIRGEPVEIVERVLGGDSLVRRAKRTLRVAEVGGSTRIGFIFGTGLVANFFERYYADGARGLPSAARIAVRVFVGSFFEDAYSRSVLDPIECEIAIDGVEHPGSAYSLVVCSVVPDLGLHLSPTYRAEEHPEKLHFVASTQSPKSLGPQVWRVVAKQRLSGDDVVDRLVSRFTIRYPIPDRGPYVLDGDLFRAHEVTVGVGPVLSVLLPVP
jgi:diacylglycerol kinase family enzyme